MFKGLKDMFKSIKNLLSEIVAGAVVISTVLIACVTGAIASLLAFLFCTPIGWIVLLILVLKHC